jgi:hypothetical protein
MLMKKIQQLLKLIIALIFISSCSDIDENFNNANSNTFLENFGNEVSRDFMGEIVDENNNPIQNAQVSIGNLNASTDGNGVFIIKNAPVREKFAFIKVEKVGYVSGSRSLVPSSEMNQVKIMMFANAPVATINSGVASQVTLPNGTKVDFDGAFSDSNGNTYSGVVNVSMFHLETSNDNLSSLMPGMLIAKSDDDNLPKVLETFGMLHVELTGTSGQKLQIAPNHTAQITMKIDDSQIATSPNSIPLWHFDEELGYWVEEGEAIKQGNNYVGNVSHFSWWNYDQFSASALLFLLIKDNNNNPISNLQVAIQRADGAFSMGQISNIFGQVSGFVPANESLNVVIVDACSNLDFLPIQALTANSTNYITLNYAPNSASPLITVNGTLQQCNAQNAINNYVILHYGNNYRSLVSADSNGDFSLSARYCLPDLNYTLTSYDYDNLQTSGEIHYIFPTNTTTVNIGTIQSCNAVSEFISYQIDNNAVVYHLTDINTSYSSNGLIISAYPNASQPGLYLWSLNNTVGNQTSFNIEGGNIGYINQYSTGNVTYTINAYGANVGDYIDISFSGTYVSSIDNQTHTITGIAHVIRDN